MVPGQSEDIVEESHFTGRLHIILVIKAIDFLLEHFAGRLRHVDDSVKFLLELGLVALLAIFEHPLVGVLKKTCL